MGLIDLETMEQAVKELHAIDENLLIYGEPWAAGDTPIDITNKGKQRERKFAVFNDNFRGLKGSVFKPRETGYVRDRHQPGAGAARHYRLSDRFYRATDRDDQLCGIAMTTILSGIG